MNKINISCLFLWDLLASFRLSQLTTHNTKPEQSTEASRKKGEKREARKSGISWNMKYESKRLG
jgi:hypothetical protein